MPEGSRTPDGSRQPEGVRPSPNIWHSPQVYEIENRAFDPDDLVTAAMRSVHDWTDADVLDIGCGSGFHLPRFAAQARSVTGVEPHPPLLTAATDRIAALGPDGVRAPIRVLPGTAQQLGIPEHSIDVAHARWAYFFGPGCEPGLAELERVMRPGGTAFVIDNDVSTSTFGRWFAREWPAYDVAAVERFWRRHGWQRIGVTTRWAMATRADFEAVVRIEFTARMAEAILAEHAGCEVDYAVNVWWRRFG